MRVHWIQTHDVRNLQGQKTELNSGINWFVGQNGQGKTNFLESVYALMTSRSFRASSLGELGKQGSGQWSIEGCLEVDDQKRILRLQHEANRTKRLVEGKRVSTYDYLGLGKAIAFNRRSLAMIEGGPDERRRFLDRLATLLDRSHLNLIADYRRHRQQLGRCVATGSSLEVYRSFKQGWIEVNRQLVGRRLACLASLLPIAQQIFESWFPGVGRLDLKYVRRGMKTGDDEQQRLQSIAARELMLKRMLAGAHLDDLSIHLNGVEARKYGSAGQVRAISLSLLLAAVEVVKQAVGQVPILVLDDLDAELDKGRFLNVLEYVSSAGQSLISTCEYAIIREFDNGTVFNVDTGTVHLERDGG